MYTQLPKKAFATTEAVLFRSGILRVDLKNRSVISKTCWFQCAVLGRGLWRSIATNSKWPAAANTACDPLGSIQASCGSLGTRCNSVRSKTRRWPCVASSTPFEGYNTYASLSGGLLTSNGVPGTVPGGSTESTPRAARYHPAGNSLPETVAVDVQLRVLGPECFRGEATERVLSLFT